MLKGDHHIELLIRSLRDKILCHFYIGHRTFSDRKAIVMVINITLKFIEIFLKMRTMLVMLNTCCNGKRKAVRKSLFFRYKGYNVLSEAVNPHIEPKTHYILNFLLYFRIVHIQVRLFLCENVKIVFVNFGIVLPCSALKGGKPVVRRLVALAFSPYVIIVIRIVNALCALLEPLMLVGGMVDNKIHKHLHSAFMCAVKYHFEIIERTEFGIDISVI